MSGRLIGAVASFLFGILSSLLGEYIVGFWAIGVLALIVGVLVLLPWLRKFPGNSRVVQISRWVFLPISAVLVITSFLVPESIRGYLVVAAGVFALAASFATAGLASSATSLLGAAAIGGGASLAALGLGWGVEDGRWLAAVAGWFLAVGMLTFGVAVLRAEPKLSAIGYISGGVGLVVAAILLVLETPSGLVGLAAGLLGLIMSLYGVMILLGRTESVTSAFLMTLGVAVILLGVASLLGGDAWSLGAGTIGFGAGSVAVGVGVRRQNPWAVGGGLVLSGGSLFLYGVGFVIEQGLWLYGGATSAVGLALLLFGVSLLLEFGPSKAVVMQWLAESTAKSGNGISSAAPEPDSDAQAQPDS